MAILRDEEEQKGQGTSQVLAQGATPGQPQPQQGQQQAGQPSGPAMLGSSAAAKPSAPVKAMPKQQKAGTGTFANLKSYLQAAQGGGQQRVAQAATQKIESAASGAQKNIQQAQDTFRQRMDAASLANRDEAGADVSRIIGTARGTTYQAPQPVPVPVEDTLPKIGINPPIRPDFDVDRFGQGINPPTLTQEQINAQNEARANYVPDQGLEKVGGPAIRPLPYYADRIGINPPRNPIIQEADNYLKTTLGDKYQDFKNELDALTKGKSLADYSNIVKDRNSIYEKYGVDTTKLPGYNSGKNLGEYARSMLQKQDSTQLGESAAPTQPQAPAQTETQQYISPEDQQRFADIINAQYQGPQSLQEAGLYEQAARKAQTAERAVNLSRTAAGREQLLKDIFSRGRDYSRGASKLDALLLNASEQGVGQVQQAAKEAGDVRQVLQQAQNLSANEATNRAKAIQDIASGARTAFTEGRTAEEQATEKRIDDMIKTPVVEKDAQGNVVLDESGQPKKLQKLDAEGKPMVDAEGKPVYMTEWDRLPEYFRNVLRTSPETNKKMQEEGIKKLEESTGLSGKRFDELPGQISQIQKKIAQLQRDIPEGSRIPGSASQRQQSNMRNQINQLSQSLKNLQGEYASYKDFGTQLQDLRKMDMKQLRLSPEEMATLGIGSGEGLYNLGQDLIGNVEARRENLITKDELSRQLALAQLAGLDRSSQLGKVLQYTDLEKAGTQDLMSSLDKKAIRESLNKAEKDFREYAGGKTVTGQGMKKDKVTGDKYRVSAQTNLKDALKKLGYDFESELPKYQAPELSKAPSTSELETNKNTIIDDITENIKPTVDPNKTFDPYTDSDSSLARKGGYAAADYGTLGITAGLRALGLDMPGAIMSGIDTALGTSIFGGGGNPSKNIKTASEQARRNLVANLQKTLESEGFYNRAAADESEASMVRQKALMDILNRKG
jgi:hypothetical protein